MKIYTVTELFELPAAKLWELIEYHQIEITSKTSYQRVIRFIEISQKIDDEKNALDILQLSKMSIDELLFIAKHYEIKSDGEGKQILIYKILEAQALSANEK